MSGDRRWIAQPNDLQDATFSQTFHARADGVGGDPQFFGDGGKRGPSIPKMVDNFQILIVNRCSRFFWHRCSFFTLN